jgi:hypothetical protein
MDVSNASYNIHKYNENKGSQMGCTKKVLKKKNKNKHWLASACRYLPMYHDDFANAYNTYICLPYLLKLTNDC